MRIRSPFFLFFLAASIVVLLAACDQSAQNIEVGDGNNLTVKGPDEVILSGYNADTSAEYKVRAFTIEKNYSWSVSGVLSDDGLRRDGEVQTVTASAPDTGAFDVSVTTNIDGQDYSGNNPGVVRYPSAEAQATSNGMNVFASLVTNAGLLELIPQGQYTAFGPSDGAFVAALDANGDQELSEQERPAPGVLANLLRYHAATQTLREADITNNQTVRTALAGEFEGTQWAEQITFGVSGGTVTVNGTETSGQITTADIATDEVTLHKIDGVLLPSSLVSITDQDVVRESGTDSVYVDGTLVFDGGFVALHEESPSGTIIGVSDYLDGSTANDPSQGFHNAVGIELDNQLTADTTTVYAMPHEDNGDQTFNQNFDQSYKRGNTSVPVIDSADVATP